MNSIRYIVLSDLHLGADNSLLTNIREGEPDPKTASPTMIAMVEYLKNVIHLQNHHGSPKVKLVLAGDIVELALCTTDMALTAFRCFLKLLFPPGENSPFDPTILYLPGNHDHHVWEMAREHTYLRDVVDQAIKEMPVPSFHVTGPLEEHGINARWLSEFARIISQDNEVKINIIYPNLAIPSSDGSRCIVVHHGHFTESIYHEMSIMRSVIFPDRRRPITVEEIETENFAWIDFLWSALGRSGGVGQDLELLYDLLHSDRATNNLIKSVSRRMVSPNPPPGFWQKIKGDILYFFMKRTAGKVIGMEIKNKDDKISDHNRKFLDNYLNESLTDELLRYPQTAGKPVDFVFGHTHKAFTERTQQKSFPGETRIYNTGGWVVDTPEPTPAHGGGAVLLDAELNGVLLRFYGEHDDSRVQCESPWEDNPFALSIMAHVSELEEMNKAFTRTALQAVRELRTLLIRRINS